MRLNYGSYFCSHANARPHASRRYDVRQQSGRKCESIGIGLLGFENGEIAEQVCHADASAAGLNNAALGANS